MTSVNPDEFYNTIKRYNEKNYFKDNSESLKCLICKNLLVNAIQTDCGCRYCSECYNQYTSDGKKKCLGSDCADIIRVVKDNAINKEIGKLKVKCLFDGCDHTDVLKEICYHLIDCPHQTLSCEKCGDKFSKDKYLDHQNVCLYRIIACHLCKEEMTWKILKDEHLNTDKETVCSKYEDVCPFKCEIPGRVNIRNHRKVCKKRPMNCLYFDVGCKTVVAQHAVEEHNSKESTQHSRLLMTEIKHLRKRITDLENANKELKEKMSVNEREIQDLRVSLSSSFNTTPVSQQGASSKVEEKSIYRNGTFIWKIENFNKLRNDAKNGTRISVTSDPFYTREFGYKMSMKIYPTGDGVGKNTHLSVFFTLMKGEYDDLLVWPFKNKVTLTIMDQKNKTADYSDTFKPDPKSTCYQQPTDEYNIASGSPKFINFHNLEENFLKNDTIFLKIQVLS